MANITQYLSDPNFLSNIQNTDAGGCPAPFISESLYPFREGFYGGRNCAPNPLVTTAGAARCCIPCPVFHWVYQPDFDAIVDGAAWINVAGLIFCFILLLSMAVLPEKYTRRSYLTIALLVSIMVLELGFIVPLVRKPPQCYDPVTPNGMHSNHTCAFGGAAITFGLMGYTCWVLVRSLFMHLQIVWNITPADISYWAANVVVWSVTIGLTSAVLAHVGVSFRFGGYCHVNVGSYSTYWGWILAFGGIALLLQIGTFIYCMKVYVSSALAMRNDPSQRSVSVTGSSRSRTARATARRVRQVLLLQWRSLALVSLAIFTTAFVCIVFIVFDNRLTEQAFANTEELIPWLLCIISTQDASQCTHLTAPIIISEDLALATIYLLSLIGPTAFFLLFRMDILRGWWAFIRTPFWKKRRGSDSSGGSKEHWGQSTTHGTQMSSQRRKSVEHDLEVGPMDIESPKDAGGLMSKRDSRPISSIVEEERRGERQVSGGSVTFATQQGEREKQGHGHVVSPV